MAYNGNGLGFNSYASRYLAGVVNEGGTTPGVLVRYAMEALSVDLWILQSGKPISVWPFYGGNAGSHALDLYRRFDITWSGTVTHDSNGVTGNGTTGIGQTGINPATVLNPSHFSVSVYSRTNSTSDTAYELGGLASSIGIYIACRQVSGNSSTRAGGPTASNMIGAVAASTGLFITHRTSTVNGASTRNGVVFISTAVATSSVPNVHYITVCAAAGLNFSARNIAFAHVGPGLADHAVFYTAVQAYQTALDRQV